MFSLVSKFNENSPKELLVFDSEDDLVQKLERQPSFLLSIMQNMRIEEEYGPFVAKLLYRINPNALYNPKIEEIVKNIETWLRNHKMLQVGIDSNFSFKNPVKNQKFIEAHKSILCLESPHFARLRSGNDFNRDIFNVVPNISDEAYQKVIEYLYLSDEDRREFFSSIDKSFLTDILQVSFHWELDELHRQCEREIRNQLQEICSKLNEFELTLTDLSNLIEIAEMISEPKFVTFFKFVQRMSKEDPNKIAEQMNSPGPAARLAQLCTPEEKKLFATFESEFGKLCRLPPEAFGVAEWEKYIGIIKDEHVPPLPEKIFEILEYPDPVEPNKKVKDTHTLFLVPVEVKGENVTINSAETFAQNPKEGNSIGYRNCWNEIRKEMGNTPIQESRWVLLRNDLIPGTRAQSPPEQKRIVENLGYEVPRALDLILVNLLTYVKTGKRLYVDGTYSRSQESVKDLTIAVGGITPAGLHVCYYSHFDLGFIGMAGAWKF